MPTTTVDGAKLSYGDEGKGPALVLLHAFPLSSRMWAPQVQALSDRYRVITPDTRGFGDSPPFGDRQEATMERLAADVVGLLDDLQLDQVVLGGLSMGGYIAMAVMALAPERVRALVLADTRCGPDGEEARHRRSAQQVQVAEEGAGSIAAGMVELLLGDTTRAHHADIVSSVTEEIASASAAGVIGALQAMKHRDDSTGLLGTLGQPTLVVVGEEDAISPLDEAETMVAILGEPTLATIPGAGHLSNLENPEAFNSALASFLSALEDD